MARISLSYLGRRFRFGIFNRIQTQLGQMIQWLFWDNFTNAEGAPIATPHIADKVGTLTVVQNDGQISISGGKSNIPAQATPVWGDLGWVDILRTRTAGLAIVAQFNITTHAIGYPLVWLQTSSLNASISATVEAGLAMNGGTNLQVYDNASAGPIVANLATSTNYYLAILLRNKGAYYFIKGGAFTNWTLLYSTTGGVDTSVYAGMSNYTSVFSEETFRVIQLPKQSIHHFPHSLINHSFSVLSPSDGQVTPEFTDIPGTGSGVVMSNEGGNWAVSGGSAYNTPALGADLWDADAAVFTSGTYSWTAYGTNTIANVANELQITYVDNSSGAQCFLRDSADLSSDLTVGTWYKISLTAHIVGNASIALYDTVSLLFLGTVLFVGPTTFDYTFRARHATDSYLRLTSLSAGEVMYIDNLSLKPYTFTDLCTLAESGENNVMVHSPFTVKPHRQAGIILRCDDASNPQNYILVYIDNNDVSSAALQVIKCVNGTITHLDLDNISYANGRELKVWVDGTSLKTYYHDTLIGSYTISDASIVNNTLHGLFSTGENTTTIPSLMVHSTRGVNLDTYIQGI